MLSKSDFKEKQVVCVFLNHGEKLSFSNDNLVLKDVSGKIKLQTSCHRLFAIFVVGSFSMTSGLLQRSKRFAFSIILLTHSFRVYAYIQNGISGNTLLRQKQYSYHGNEIAKELVRNKIESQINALNLSRSGRQLCEQTCASLKEYLSSIDCLDEDVQQSLLGIEGSASRQYFAQMFRCFEWKGRQPRLKRDPCNSLLDVGYTLLFCYIEALTHCYDFDVYQGVYHKQFYMRKSLICDLVEPFRPIVDLAVRRLLQCGKVQEEHFLFVKGQYLLKYSEGKELVGELLAAILEFKEEMFLFIQRYYRYFMQMEQGRQFQPFVLGSKMRR